MTRTYLPYLGTMYGGPAQPLPPAAGLGGYLLPYLGRTNGPILHFSSRHIDYDLAFPRPFRFAHS